MTLFGRLRALRRDGNGYAAPMNLLRRRPRCLLLAWALLATGGVQAQGRGGLHMPSLPSMPSINPRGLERLPDDVLERSQRGLERAAEAAQEATQRLAPDDPVHARKTLVDTLLRRERQRLERDPAGEPIVRGELLLTSPKVATLDAAQAAGFRLLRDEDVPALGLYLVVLGPPPGMDTAAALRRLRQIDPAATQDFNHLYLPAGTVEPRRAVAAAGTVGAAGTGSGRPTAPADTRIGLVDGGVDARHPALRHARIEQHGCDGDTVADPHGTAVASLLVGRDARFEGAAAGATLYAADIYCGSPARGSVDAVVQALAWLVQQRVGVINLSLVGPPNQLLQRAVAAVQARGHLLVAAVGNDGPAAPPLYPAAYPGVIGVTGVDPRDRVLPEAGEGPQVAFAAPGSELAVALAGDRGFTAARGTSFASPLVAGLLARGLRQPDARAAAAARAALATAAQDLGAPGRDPVYGDGLVGRELRTPPEAVNAGH